MKETAINIVKRLRLAGHTAYFAGGCVRDMVRGVEPKDFDIATSARPEEVQKLFSHTVAVGAQFGVILVIEGGHNYEVATFRSDEAYIDGRRPSAVTFSSPEQDAQRRDFTVNGLFFDPIEGSVIDFVGGQEDLKRKLVRSIGDPRLRLEEDKLRLLRCVRLASTLGFEIEPKTFETVRAMAPHISVVSAERIRDELIKMFTSPNGGRGLQLLDDSGLLREILPEIEAMKSCEQPPEFHPEGDVFTHTKLMLDSLPPNPSVVLAFAVLLHDVGKPPTFERAPDRIRFNNHDRIGAEMTERILRRLRFPNDVIAKVTACVDEHMRFQFVQEMRLSKLKRILARETFADELELHRLDCLASHTKLDNYDFLRAKAVEIPPEVAKPKPLLTGNDLLAMGFAEGPIVGKILADLKELQLDGKLTTPEQARKWVKANNPSPNT